MIITNFIPGNLYRLKDERGIYFGPKLDLNKKFCICKYDDILMPLSGLKFKDEEDAYTFIKVLYKNIVGYLIVFDSTQFELVEP